MILLLISMGWAQSNDWKKMFWAPVEWKMLTRASLPPLLETARELYPNIEQWQIIDSGVDFSKEEVSSYFHHKEEPGAGVAPLLQGMSSFIERSLIETTPRQSPWWDEVSVSSYMDEGTSYQQFGTTRYHKEGDLEAISIDVRYWFSELAYMYSEHQYCSFWVLTNYIFIYKSGVAVGAYLHRKSVLLYPSYTDEEWESRKTISKPDWGSLLARPDVQDHEYIFTFHYNEEGSLRQVELFKHAQSDKPQYTSYKPSKTIPPDNSSTPAHPQ